VGVGRVAAKELLDHQLADGDAKGDAGAVGQSAELADDGVELLFKYERLGGDVRYGPVLQKGEIEHVKRLICSWCRDPVWLWPDTPGQAIALERGFPNRQRRGYAGQSPPSIGTFNASSRPSARSAQGAANRQPRLLTPQPAPKLTADRRAAPPRPSTVLKPFCCANFLLRLAPRSHPCSRESPLLPLQP
jgi:hypothetical protein